MEGKNNIANIIDDSGNLTPAAIRRYLANEVTEEERKKIEEHLEKSPFDREAVEGYRQVPSADVDAGIADIHGRMEASMERRRHGGSSRIKYRTWYAIGMAASVILLVGIVFLLSTLQKETGNRIAQAEEKTGEKKEMMTSKGGIESEDMHTITKDNEPEEPVATKSIANEKGVEGFAGEEKSASGAGAGKIPEETYTIALMEEDVDDETGVDPAQMLQDNIVLDVEAEQEEPVAVMQPQSPAGVEDGEKTDRMNGVVESQLSGAIEGKGSGKQKPEKMGVAANKNTDEMQQATPKELMQQRDSFMADKPLLEPQQVFTVVEEMPQFPGGDTALQKYLTEHIEYPIEAMESGVQGRVIVSFVVEKDGSVSDARVKRGIGHGCDEEALRVVRHMPVWIPGKQRGQPVRVQYNLPVRFNL